MLKRKDRILISALELLEESGVSGVTTKRLAQKEGITEPALYRQYKNKGQIIKRIIDEYGSYDDKIMNTIRESSMSGRDKVLFYVNRYCELYENYSELTTVMLSMDLYFYEPETKAQMKATIQRRGAFLSSIIEEGKKDGTIKNVENSETLAAATEGIIVNQIIAWRLTDTDKTLNDLIVSHIEGLLHEEENIPTHAHEDTKKEACDEDTNSRR